MAYVLKFDNCDDAMSFKNKFNELLPTSRFKCELRSDYRPRISLQNIRLKESKPYCGNHPGSCKVVEKKKK